MRTFLTYLCLALVAFSTNGQNQLNNNDRTLHVKGVAILKQIPNMVSVSINIKAESKEYNSCHDKLMMTIQNAKGIFTSKDIDKNIIKTIDLRITENKSYNRNGEQVKLGYIGSASILIESDYSVKFTQKLISALADSISFNYNISFQLSESQKELLRKDAISKAIEDAKEKATLMAESSNIRLGEIKSIVYNGDILSLAIDRDIVREYLWRPSSGYFAAGTDDAYPPERNPITDFNPKEVKIIKGVEVVWSIKDKN